MARRKQSAPRRLARNVELNQGEELITFANGVRFGPLGLNFFGTLTLTSQKLVWTPWPSLFEHWNATREQVQGVSVYERFPLDAWRTELRVQLQAETRKFGLDARLVRTRHAEEFATKIKQWANISG